MSTVERARLRIHSGDRAPFSYGMTGDKAFYSFDAQAGRPAAVILAGRLPPPATAAIVAAFQRRAADFPPHEADVLLLIDAQGPRVQDYVANPPQGVTAVYCLPEVLFAWGFDSLAPLVVVTDRNMRVLAIADADPVEAAVDAALACIAAAPAEPPRDIVLPAPVLLVPNLLSASLCRALIDCFDASAHVAGGMASIDARGNAIHKIDESKKKREDYILPPDSVLGESVLGALARICLPEMKRAFQFDACHIDRILIARYDDTGGYFRRHRDNSAPAVAFRQFAISVNLNSGDYEGGHLLFPEYNSHRYKPGRGAGVVFSASLLHEATPVTRGSRYVVLSFLHDAAGEARRLGFVQQQAAQASAAASA